MKGEGGRKMTALTLPWTYRKVAPYLFASV